MPGMTSYEPSHRMLTRGIIRARAQVIRGSVLSKMDMSRALGGSNKTAAACMIMAPPRGAGGGLHGVGMGGGGVWDTHALLLACAVKSRHPKMRVLVEVCDASHSLFFLPRSLFLSLSHALTHSLTDSLCLSDVCGFIPSLLLACSLSSTSPHACV